MVSSFYFFSRLSPFFSSILVFVLPLFLFSCQTDSQKKNKISDSKIESVNGISSITHAIGFDLIDYDKYKVLHLFRHYNESVDTLSYVLSESDTKTAKIHSSFERIKIPVQKVALLHSSYLSFFKFCGITDKIAAISEAKYIFDQEIFHLVSGGELPEVGYGETIDKEKMLQLGITLTITVGWPDTPNKGVQMIEELGIPVLVFSEWQENTLLGRAEWVKVVAALAGVEQNVHAKFLIIEKEYRELTELAKRAGYRSKIICNLPYKGSWYVPGGKSYMSHLIADAGGDYIWSDDAGTGGIQMDFEAIYAKGINADIWINAGSAKSINEIVLMDERLNDFAPIMNKKVFNYINRVVRGSANDYWESAIIQPQVVLSDYIKMFHPELLPNYQLYYYKQLGYIE